MKVTTIITIILLISSVQSFSQVDTVKVGNPKVNASHIQPFEVNWIATKHFSSIDSIAIIYRVSEKFEVLNEENRDILKFTQYWNNEDNKNIFTTVRTADLNTMEYIAFHSGSSPGGLTHLDFDGRYISGFISFDSHKKAKQIGGFIEEPVFASLAGILYAILLKGYDEPIIIPVFSYGGENPILKYEKIEIIGNETISLTDNSKRKTRIIKSTRNPSNTYWIDSTLPPYFIKVSVEQSDGSIVMYEIEDYKLIEEN